MVSIDVNKLPQNADLTLYKPTKTLGQARRNLNGDMGDIRPRKVARFLDVVGRVGGGQRPELMEALEPGPYFIQVESRSRREARYRIRVSSEDVILPDAVPLDTSQAIAIELENNLSLEGELSVLNPAEVYQFDVAADPTRITATSASGESIIRLFQADGQEITTTSSAYLLGEGTFFVQVSRPVLGDYQVFLTRNVPQVARLYSGVGSVSQSGTLAPIQLPLTEASVLAVADALEIPPESIPPNFIAPRPARESIAADGSGTVLNTELFEGEGTGWAGYETHLFDPNSVEILSLLPVPVIQIGLVPINPEMILDRANGYRVEFEVSVDSQLSSGAPGFTLITIGSDGQTGIELGWTPSGIVAMNPDLSPTGEQVSFNTTTSASYALTVQGEAYSLEANGQEILVGTLRDYDSSTVVANPVIPYDPYSTPNFLFFGDNNDFANSTFTVEQVDLFY
ncbi:MAG: hypothetical protein F6K30_19970 [Cyanothece sp. SIO2G6]|nr:hypothetical protein [Cyanothece sp. SIO2G6]